ncbi:hypothetical protein M0R04_03130 [Candidatus Dojkabacteria bacterium]|jgi:hypothetical protein|nr:hypothetical protein [Candidatus Dojkabacteria bacterium]
MKSSFPIKISLDQYIFIHRTLRDALFNNKSEEDILRLIKKRSEVIKVDKQDNNYLTELPTPKNPLDSKYVCIVFKPKRLLYTLQLTENGSYILNCWVNREEQKIVQKHIDLKTQSISKPFKQVSSHKKGLFHLLS